MKPTLWCRRRPSRVPMRRQDGMAVVLMMLMTGMAVTATVLGTASSIRGTQEQHLAVHTQTRAQLRAWTGVQVVRSYLSSLPASDLAALTPNTAIAISGVTGVAATLVSNVQPDPSGSPGRHRLVVHVTGSGAGANSTVEAVIETGGTATPPSSSESGGVNAVTIRRDLLLSGHIIITGNTAANVTVEGNAELRGTVTGVNRMCTVKDENGNGGNLEIHSAITVAYVCADGNLELTGGSNVGTAETTGNVLLSGGGTSIGMVLSNQDVILSGGSATAQTVQAAGDVSVTGGNARAVKIETEGDVLWTSSNWAETIDANGSVSYSGNNAATVIRALGDVTLTGGGNVGTVLTKGNTSITSYWGQGIRTRLDGEGNLSWANGGNVVASGTVGGTLSGPTNSAINVNQVGGYTIDLPPFDVPTYVPLEVPPIEVDVYPLRSAAHYVFEADGSGRRLVTVQGVNDIPNGTYFLGSYPWGNGRGHMDFLCLQLKANNTECQTPATPFKTICEGYSTSNSCLGYNNGTWTLAGKSLAPGVLWFDGNLNLSNGVYFNTFLVMGNITTGGSMRLYSVNYAGHAPICLNDRSAFSGVTASPPDFAGLYPQAYCAGGTYNSTSLGNSALIAGGFRNNVFEGGDIALGASNKIYGSVIAGDILTTTGSTEVTGQIIVAAQDPSSTQTTWSGSTTVHMSEDHEDFDPDANPFDDSDGAAGTNSDAKLLWSRYL